MMIVGVMVVVVVVGGGGNLSDSVMCSFFWVGGYRAAIGLLQGSYRAPIGLL